MAWVIGVMARAPIPGRCKTRLAAAVGPERAADIYRAMLLDTLARFELTGAARCVVMAAPENDGARMLAAIVPPRWETVAQEGAGLGARLAGAFRTLGGGGDAVALVSSDSPTVPIEHVREALMRTREPRRALVGPCEDGGYYLIGLTTTGGGETGILDGIAWSTAGVLEQTRGRCAELGLQLEELPPGYDVDEPHDLERLGAELARYPERAPRTARLLVNSTRQA